MPESSRTIVLFAFIWLIEDAIVLPYGKGKNYRITEPRNVRVIHVYCHFYVNVAKTHRGYGLFSDYFMM